VRFLITGGSGFIGSHLINLLLQEDQSAEIINIDLKPAKEEHARLVTNIVDINNQTALNALHLEDIDTCVHLAALCKEPGFEWDQYFETNHVGTINMLDLCRKLNINKLLFTSTMMVYKADEERRHEYSITSPDTAYGTSKLLAEKEIEKWSSEDTKRSYHTIRPSVVFGKFENGNFTRLYYALKKNRFAFVGRKGTVKSCVYVKDVCGALSFLANKGKANQTYNFAFIKDYQIGEIVATFKEVFEIKGFYPVLPYRLLLMAAGFFQFLNGIGLKNAIHPRRIQKLYFSTNIDSSKIINEKYEFQYDLKEALIDWQKSTTPKELY